ncbi:YheC/YheD family protein [Paenibacillus terrigena]|uniref:YheC/YheD family protein n=1 Tax=Paenibacillus terrigena TaxID=369333 RepID=UPI000369B5B2|nr:YheC/YheD family protein [Paenibacillus terrigena]
MSGAEKIRKNEFMKQDDRLRPHIPVTLKATPTNFRELLDKYSDIIFKPINGSRGRNVYRVTSLRSGRYRIHHESNIVHVYSKEEVFNRIQLHSRTYDYLVQPRIRLAKINGRPFDLRVIVQRKRNSKKWKVTGKVAKVAGKGYIVTNITRSGGTVRKVRTAIRQSSLQPSKKRNLLPAINRLAVTTASRLKQIYPSQRIYGLDMGVDKSGHLWIIEANRRPAMSHFLKLRDRTMYRRIRRWKSK